MKVKYNLKIHTYIKYKGKKIKKLLHFICNVRCVPLYIDLIVEYYSS
jgi:hypothetical protein